MPCPDSWYQSPSGVMPAFFQIASSILWVPELSPREINGAWPLRFFGKPRRQCGALDRSGVSCWSDNDKVVVHDQQSFSADTFSHQLLFRGWGVDQEHIGVALFPISRASPVPTATVLTTYPVSS